MIYFAIAGSVLAVIGFVIRSRSTGVKSTALDTIASATLGWFAGLLIGVGARIGMWAIPFFNGAESRITFDGTFRVVLTFSLFGVGLALIYEFFFRRLLREHGLLFGLLITLIVWYPLGSQGLQQVRFLPPFFPAAAVTFAIMAITFIPYAVMLEFLLARWHMWYSARSNVVRHGV